MELEQRIRQTLAQVAIIANCQGGCVGLPIACCIASVVGTGVGLATSGTSC